MLADIQRRDSEANPRVEGLILPGVDDIYIDIFESCKKEKERLSVTLEAVKAQYEDLTKKWTI